MSLIEENYHDEESPKSVKLKNRNLMYTNITFEDIKQVNIPSFSLVIEWENVLHVEFSRATKMLSIVSEQMMELSQSMSFKPELIISYNPDEIKKEQVEKIVDKYLSKCKTRIDLKIIPGRGLHYYELKNNASSYCTKEIIIFLDSDIIPEDNWLINLLAPFQNKEISVVGGHTYINSESFYERSFALYWHFPLQLEYLDHVCEKETFVANNMAIRRKVFENFHFPISTQFRGQCVTLSEILWRNRIMIYRTPFAKGNHPAPKFKRFFLEALCEGYDISIIRKRIKKNNLHQYNYNKNSSKKIPPVFTRIRSRFRLLGFTTKDAVAAYGIVFTYLGLRQLGLWISYIRPQIIRNNLQI